MGRLAGKTAIVTGAARGMGEATARLFASEGANVVLTDVLEDRLASGAPNGRTEMSQIDGLPPLREVIAAHDLRAKKSLGQNFLLDLNLTAKIARQAGDLSACDVLEVGPGPGGLTRGLLAEGARKVLAIEKDTRCLPALAEIADAYPGRLEVLNADALEIDATQHLTPPIRVVANLPYNVGTELLIRWLTPALWPPYWDSLTLMFQREVAQRIVAQPGHQGLWTARDFGRSGARMQRSSWICAPEAFVPAPEGTLRQWFISLRLERTPGSTPMLQSCGTACGRRRLTKDARCCAAAIERPR